MKMLVTCCVLLGLATSAFAVDKSDLDKRVRKLTSKFGAMQANSDKRIPAETLKKAKGIVLMDRTKAGFIFAYQGGNGVALVRDKSGSWGLPGFMKATEASLGFQIGGQQSFIVVLLMTTNAVGMLTDHEFTFGGEASGTAGKATGKAEGVVSSSDQPVVIYSDTEGLYGGAAIKGGAFSPDGDANLAYYEESFSMSEILIDKKPKSKPTEAITALIKKLDESAKK
jgi:lipid-binding SYLF domain-containing protein